MPGASGGVVGEMEQCDGHGCGEDGKGLGWFFLIGEIKAWG